METYIIILAGGSGRRLWPVSRRNLPKQFIDIFGTGETLLQQTCARAANVVGLDHIIVVTNHEYCAIAEQQLPWLPKGHLLAEPVHRNTCPAAAWAIHRVMCEAGNDSVVVLMPADQIITNEERFRDAILAGAGKVVGADTILTVGATPTRTEPGYGYIQVGDNGQVRSFIEKPDYEFAKVLIESGEFLWNTGIYLARTGYIREQMKKILPIVLRDVRGDVQEETEFVRQNYSRYPNMSLDLAILEKMPVRSVMHCDFGWADVGTWHGIYEAVTKDTDDNVLVNQQSKLISDGSHRNVVSLPDGTLAIIAGLENYIVAQKDNVLLICPKGESSSMIRRFATKVENDDGMGEKYM